MATQPKVVSDLGTLLKIPNKVLDELINKLNLCIGSTIHEARIAGEQAVVINIGIGTLSINLVDMQCKFIPSKALKTTIKKSLASSTDPLELELEKVFVEKLIAACDEAL